MRTLIKNIKIVRPSGILENHALIIDGGKIEALIKQDAINEKDYKTIINGKFNYLAPGFIDIHNHGNSGYDTMDATNEALTRIAAYHLKNGVTSFLATTISSPKTALNQALLNLKEYHQIQRQNKATATLEGIYFEGPYFNVEKKGAQPKSAIIKPKIEEMKGFIKTANHLIKVVAFAPEIEGALDLATFLKKENIIAAMAHTNATYKESLKGFEAGVSLATHLYNGMRGFTHREPGALGAILTDANIYAEMIVDGVHLHDAAITLALKAKGTDKLILISDAMRAAGLKDGIYDLGGQKVETKNTEARLVETGSIAGSTLNLNQAAKNMLKTQDVSIVDIVNMASTNPAKLLNLKHIGTIEPGKRADLILFDQDFNLKNIIKFGQEMANLSEAKT